MTIPIVGVITVSLLLRLRLIIVIIESSSSSPSSSLSSSTRYDGLDASVGVAEIALCLLFGIQVWVVTLALLSLCKPQNMPAGA